MSTNKSEHLNLHLWEPEDDFLRTEFNENFAALAMADNACCPENKPYVTGSYKGTGTYGSGASTVINAGFRPSTLILCQRGDSHLSAVYPMSNTGYADLTWTDNGVILTSSKGASAQYNSSDVSYFYIIFREREPPGQMAGGFPCAWN